MPIPSLLLAAAIVIAGEPRLHVALAFPSESTLPPTVAAAAVQEAAAIWSRYRVVVDRTLPCASAPDEAIVLTVRTGRAQTRGSIDQPTALGAINFNDDGTPYSLVTIYFDLLLRSVVLARLGDISEDRWPAEVRQLVIGRALGRVLAHEIGHYLLGARGHSSNGLMRAVQPYYELFGQSGVGFVLTRTDEERLARSIGR
jgi:hypothetical protein